jgi:hypothetical protein
MHSQNNESCAPLNKDLGDYLLWKIHGYTRNISFYKFKKYKKSFDLNICWTILLNVKICFKIPQIYVIFKKIKSI